MQLPRIEGGLQYKMVYLYPDIVRRCVFRCGQGRSKALHLVFYETRHGKDSEHDVRHACNRLSRDIGKLNPDINFISWTHSHLSAGKCGDNFSGLSVGLDQRQVSQMWRRGSTQKPSEPSLLDDSQGRHLGKVSRRLPQ